MPWECCDARMPGPQHCSAGPWMGSGHTPLLLLAQCCEEGESVCERGGPGGRVSSAGVRAWVGECGYPWGVVYELPCESRRVRKRNGVS